MKKLMFAIAAVAAGVALADVTSANIVGYNKYASRTGYKLIAGSFISVADAKDQFSLADLKADGYTKPFFNTEEEDDQHWDGGLSQGSFQINILNEEGAPIECYEYVDFVEGGDPQRDGDNDDLGTGWWRVDVETLASEKMDEEDVKATKFDIGQAFYVMNVSGDELALSSAGQVTANAIEFPAQAGYTCIGNGTAADLTLFDLMAKGYTLPFFNTEEEDDQHWDGGLSQGSFQINILNEEGAPIACYEYVDFVEGGDPQRDGDNDDLGTGWWCVDVETLASEKMDEEAMKAVKINAGDSYYVMNVSGEELSLFIPAADID